MADQPLWTTADRDALKAAVIALATGKRAVTVSFSSGGGASRSTEYGQADLPQLRSLLAEVNAAVNDAPRSRSAGYDKGFDTTSGGSDV